MIRVRKLADRNVQESVGDNVAIFARAAFRMSGPAMRQVKRAAEKEMPPRPRWRRKVWSHHRVRHIQSVSLCVAQENRHSSDKAPLFVYNSLQHFSRLKCESVIHKNC